MSSDVAIRIEGLGKSYRINHQEQHVTLAEQVLDRLRHPFHRSDRETFWALRDIDLMVPRGEVLGLIGHNGAGKSTLLKVLSRITPPTAGRVELFGRVGSLLEVGTGFHPELSGRENIYLNGAILGMRKQEIARQFDAIVQFAGVERFLDTPVKRYSSGMYVRLAFSVAAHLDTEILFVDEVLSVGDADFQDRCLGKMSDIVGAGRTIILVSHNLANISALASQCVLLADGQVRAHDATDVVLSHYQTERRTAAASQVATSRPSRHPVALTSIELVSDICSPEARFARFRIQADVTRPCKAGVGVGVILKDLGGTPVAAGYARKECPSGSFSALLGIDLKGLPIGEYRATVNMACLDHWEDWIHHDSWDDAFTLLIAGGDSNPLTRLWDRSSHGYHQFDLAFVEGRE